MLFATYGAPTPPRSTNPLVIILGVCGGCVLLVVIGVIVITVIGANALKNVTGGVVTMTKTMPEFLGDLKSHNYSGAANLVDPTAQATLTEAKIKSMEEAVEKKLGKLQSYPRQFSSQSQNTKTSPGAAGGKATIIEYVYTYPLTYEKGTATATFKFLLDASGAQGGDISKMKLSGKVTDFNLTPDTP
jgi:hypothetical protein